MKILILITSFFLATALFALPADAQNATPAGKRDEVSSKQAKGVEKRAAREEDRERSDKERETAEERAEHQRKDSEGQADRLTGRDNAATRGNEKSQEMRERNEERAAIKEEYRANSTSDAAIDSDIDEEGVDAKEQKKAKKPWWKVWGD